MGRPNKPTAVKEAAGNPGKRKTNKQEPDPDYLKDLTPPVWLSESAKAVWKELAPPAARARVLTVIDVEAFAHGCVAIARFRKAASKLEEQGELKGEGINPWMMIKQMSAKHSLAIFKEFGMTPAARSRVQVQPQALLFDNEAQDSKQAAGYFH